MKAIEHEITDQEYEDELNNVYGEVEICGMTFDSGRALHELDPIAFRCGQSDEMKWECSECGKVYDEEQDAADCCPPEE
jgi:hypothetical protein